MKETEINYKFVLGRRITHSKDLSGSFSPYTEKINCAKCNNEIIFTIKMYGGGWPLSNLYKDNNYIIKEEIISNKAAMVANQFYNYLGELTLNRLPALYSSKICSHCNSQYIIIFGTGETQPSRDEIQITGIWEIIKNEI